LYCSQPVVVQGVSHVIEAGGFGTFVGEARILGSVHGRVVITPDPSS
jgi:hypothetical protein